MKERDQTILETSDILRLLPHRYPFLLVDRIVEIEKEKSAVGLKNVSLNEEYFQGHFPDRPVMPGVLIIEAMAQVGGILMAYSSQEKGKRTFYFASVEQAKFRRPVLPGDQIKMKVELLRSRSKISKFRGEAFVDGSLVAEAEFTIGSTTNDPVQRGTI